MSPLFAHGQLYVACSQVGSQGALHVAAQTTADDNPVNPGQFLLGGKLECLGTSLTLVIKHMPPMGGQGRQYYMPPPGGGAGGHPFRGKGQWGNSAFGRRCGSSNAQGILGGLGTLPGGASDRPFSAMSLPMRGHFLRLPWTPPQQTHSNISHWTYTSPGEVRLACMGGSCPPPMNGGGLKYRLVQQGGVSVRV